MSGKRRPGRGTDKKGRSKWGPPHVRLHWWLLDCEAYRNLSLVSRAALVELYQRFNGTNNGGLSFSVREMAERLRVAPNTALKGFGELEDKGFIRPKQRGAFSLKARHATTWILTEFEYAGNLPTKDFMKWQPNDENQKPVSKSDIVGIKNCDRSSRRNPKKRPGGIKNSDREPSKAQSHGIKI